MASTRLLFVTLIVVLLALDLVPGCHRKRKKRATLVTKTVKRFFPTCMKRQLSGVPAYANRNWRGAVSFTLFHSDWYEQANKVCIGDTDTVQCWLDLLPSFISSSSSSYRAAQRCIKAYNDDFKGFNSPEPVYPTGIPFADSATCAAVDKAGYKADFFATANANSLSATDELLTDFDDVLEFAKKDMICNDPIRCSCSNLAVPDDQDTDDYDFADGKSCGSCWTTRFATSFRNNSRLKRPASAVAKKRARLRRKPKAFKNNSGNPGRGGGRGRGHGGGRGRGRLRGK